MPDPNIISRDPFQRAKADAEAKYGGWRPLMPTLSVDLASRMIMLTAAGVLGLGADASRVLEVLTITIGVAAVVAYLWEWRLL